MDVVIPVRQDGRERRELLFCLRSLERHGQGLSEVYLVTDEVFPFLQDVRYIRFPDLFRNNSHANTLLKCLAACACPLVTDPFLWMNLDMYLMAPLNLSSYLTKAMPALRPLHEEQRRSNYGALLQATARALAREGATFRHYDLHYPLVVHKHQFLEAFSRLSWDHGPPKILWRSWYGNLANLTYEEVVYDCKVYKPEEQQELWSTWPILSSARHRLRGKLLAYLEKQFPSHSHFEAPPYTLGPFKEEADDIGDFP